MFSAQFIVVRFCAQFDTKNLIFVAYLQRPSSMVPLTIYSRSFSIFSLVFFFLVWFSLFPNLFNFSIYLLLLILIPAFSWKVLLQSMLLPCLFGCCFRFAARIFKYNHRKPLFTCESLIFGIEIFLNKHSSNHLLISILVIIAVSFNFQFLLIFPKNYRCSA